MLSQFAKGKLERNLCHFPGHNRFHSSGKHVQLLQKLRISIGELFADLNSSFRKQKVFGRDRQNWELQELTSGHVSLSAIPKIMLALRHVRENMLFFQIKLM